MTHVSISLEEWEWEHILLVIARYCDTADMDENDIAAVDALEEACSKKGVEIP